MKKTESKKTAQKVGVKANRILRHAGILSHLKINSLELLKKHR